MIGTELRIVSLKAQHYGEEILVTVETSTPIRQEFSLLGVGQEKETHDYLLLISSYAELKPRLGPIDEEMLEAIKKAAALREAVTVGVRFLTFGRNTKHSLSQKLLSRGLDRASVQEAVLYLEEKKLLNEREDAISEAERQVEKMRGRSKILAVLYSKGYDQDAIQTVKEEVLDGVNFNLLCAKRIEKCFPELPRMTEEEGKTKIASLMRAGFSISNVRAALSYLRRRGS